RDAMVTQRPQAVCRAETRCCAGATPVVRRPPRSIYTGLTRQFRKSCRLCDPGHLVSASVVESAMCACNTLLTGARRSLRSARKPGPPGQERRPSDQVGQIGVPGAKAGRGVGRVGEQREIREFEARTYRAADQRVG